MHVAVLLDASTSMRFDRKFDLARQLAAAFALMGLHGGERVSVFAGHHAAAAPDAIPGLTGRPARRRILDFLTTRVPDGDASIEHSMESMLRIHRGRGIAVILSDFLTFGNVSRPFRLLHSAGLEVWAVQILGTGELHPDLTDDVRFVDSETGLSLDISSARELLGLYQQHRQRLETHLAELCRGQNGRFVSLSSAQTLPSILFDMLLRQGWMR